MDRSRDPLEACIKKQKAKLAKIDERLGHMMSTRSIEEERLADMLRLRERLCDCTGSPHTPGCPAEVK